MQKITCDSDSICVLCGGTITMNMASIKHSSGWEAHMECAFAYKKMMDERNKIKIANTMGG